jgi:hypothetical protein
MNHTDYPSQEWPEHDVYGSGAEPARGFAGGNRIGNAIRQYPFATAVVGGAVAALAWRQFAQGRAGNGVDDNGSSRGRAAREAISTGVKQSARAMRQSARAVGRSARAVGSAGRAVGRVPGSLGRFIRENPGAATAVAVATGLAAGFAIPESRAEHRLMGDTRDALASQAREVVDKTVGDVRDTAGQLADVAQRLSSPRNE